MVGESRLIAFTTHARRVAAGTHQGDEMNRSELTDDCGEDEVDEWRRMVDAAIHSPEGQAFLRELAHALDALPDKWLINGSLVNDDGDCCAIGAVCEARGIDTAGMDSAGARCVAELLGIPFPLAAEIVARNDGFRETPAARWQRMRRWVDDILHRGTTNDRTANRNRDSTMARRVCSDATDSRVD